MSHSPHPLAPDAPLACASAGGTHTLDPGDFFEANPIPTLIINTDHIVTHMNGAYAHALGIKPQDVIGTRSLGCILYGHERPILADLVLDHSLSGHFDGLYPHDGRRSSQNADVLESEAFLPLLGEHGRWFFVTAVALRDKQGLTIGAIQTALDITERKRTEDALMQAQEALSRQLALVHDQLVHNDKLASIGQLAAGVAHEINNPIGYVFSNFGTLEKYLKSMFDMLSAYEAAESNLVDGATRRSLQALRERLEIEYLKEDIPALMGESREGIERVRKIVQDLKDFSHVDSTQEWQFADLVKCIDSTLNVVNNEVKYKADIVRVFTEVPEVECQASEINQVIMNLVVNAAQSIGSERGTITIRNGSDGKFVWFEIADTGSGIAKANLTRIFDPFYTTKPVGKGTGLGLSISYGIVQKHHGHIQVHTVVGEGTTFRVELPILQPSPETAESTRES